MFAESVDLATGSAPVLGASIQRSTERLSDRACTHESATSNRVRRLSRAGQEGQGRACRAGHRDADDSDIRVSGRVAVLLAPAKCLSPSPAALCGFAPPKCVVRPLGRRWKVSGCRRCIMCFEQWRQNVSIYPFDRRNAHCVSKAVHRLERRHLDVKALSALQPRVLPGGHPAHTQPTLVYRYDDLPSAAALRSTQTPGNVETYLETSFAAARASKRRTRSNVSLL